ncbi:IS110 family transposase [Streptomyces caeruleatus]|uniref:IS110 family transposase n=1 Tax=Streptomyces caeruleatus TaxID=661399 RepID=UPI003CC601AB
MGVDTHRDFNVAAALDERGRKLGTLTVPTTSAGNQSLLAWARSLGETVRGFALEGTGSYGASLTRHLLTAGEFVVEATRPRRDRQASRNDGKSDFMDALRAAKALLAEDLDIAPKHRDGDVEVLRLLLIAKRSAVKARTQAVNAMRAILVTAPDELRNRLRGTSKDELIERCLRLRPAAEGLEAAAKRTLRHLARRCRMLTEEADQVDAEVAEIVRRAAPELLELHGVGTGTAATLLVAAGDNPTRMRSEASFAHMAGVAPLPTGSGLTSGRHRLNRGGNRQANNALWTVVVTRMRTDERTQKYLARRTAEGKSKKEIVRCLKRYVAREIYRTLLARYRRPSALAST